MRRRARPLLVKDDAQTEQLFAENERRTGLFVTFDAHDYEGSDAEQRARAYVKFQQDENDRPASRTDYDVVLAPGQSLRAAQAFLELPKGPVSVLVVNPAVIAGRQLLVMASEHSFEAIPPLYAEDTFEKAAPGGTDGRAPSDNPHGRQPAGRGCLVPLPNGTFCRRP